MADFLNTDTKTETRSMSPISETHTVDALTELGRATTLYHEAPPERFEAARQQYEEALRVFKAGA